MRNDISLYLDENVSAVLARNLKSHGFDILTTQEANNSSKSDEVQMEYAVQQKRTMLTHDFEEFQIIVNRYFEQNKLHYGVMFAPEQPIANLAKKLLVILNRDSAEDMINQVRYI